MKSLLSKSQSRLLTHGIIIVLIIVAGGFLVKGYQDFLTTEVRASGGTYHEGIIGTPRFINPVLAQSNADRDLTKLTFSSLLDVMQDGTVTYQLANHLEVSKDQKVYTLSLDPRAQFSDGTPLTAEDVVFTVEKIQSPLIKSPLYSNWVGVGVEATGAREVTFTLAQPYADFIYNLTIGVLPEHLWGDVSDEEFTFHVMNTYPVGPGSYMVDEVRLKQSGSPREFVLVPNPHSLKKPYISSFVITNYEDAHDLIDAYLSHDIDGAYGIAPSSIDGIDLEFVHDGSLSRTFGIFFNTENNKSTLDSSVRKALSYAINRDAIIKQVFNGFADETDNPMGTVTDTEYSKEKALEMLSKAGWKPNSEGTLMKSISGKNTPLTFTLSFPNIAEVEEVAQMITQDLSAIGVEVTLASYEQNDLTNEVIRTRDYDALLFGYVLEKPSDAFAFWHSSQKNDPGLNISVYGDARVDAALANMRSQQERDDDIKAFVSAWKEDMPAIMLYSPQYLYLGSTTIEVPSSIAHASERFNNISDWYERTRHIWNFLIRDEE